MLSRHLRRQSLALAALLPALSLAPAALAQDMAKPAPAMQAVLDKLKALEAKPIHQLSVPEARTQASPADAAKAVQWEKRSLRRPSPRC